MMRKPTISKNRQVRRARSVTVPLSADVGLGDTVAEYTRRVKTSKATAYRQMADGSLRYVMIRGQRRIPHSEYVRMGLVPAEQGIVPRRAEGPFDMGATKQARHRRAAMVRAHD
jgi:hypothetical protein